MFRSAAASFALTVILAATAATPALSLEAPPLEPDALGFERTPPRLGFIDGEVSLVRPGADDPTPARVNTPLAAGDELTTGERANVELQIGPRAYLRAASHTALGLASLEPDFLQFRLTRGAASLDVRSLREGHTLEIDTPNAAFTIERAGYYRIEVDESRTVFSSRRGGNATATPASGQSVPIAANEQLVVTGVEDATLATYPAPAIDEWDRWNYARTADQQGALSSRYVPDDVYGAEDLDRHGSWRVVPDYGSVWIPRVAVGWSPYSSGIWAWDAYYGYSWVDDAPWGWAPFHYGRWVRVDGFWAWCPGPRVVRAYYAPALVAFYGTHGFSVGLGFGSGYIGWVPLGWGEPLVPWWGPRGCRGNVHWAGWGGPRVINKVVIHNDTVVNVANVKHYSHGRLGRGHGRILGMDRKHFGHQPVHGGQIASHDAAKLRPLRDGDLGVAPSPDATAVESNRRGKLARPSGGERSVVSSTRRSGDRSETRLSAVQRSERPRREQRQEVRQVQQVQQQESGSRPTPPRFDRTQREQRGEARPGRRSAVAERREHARPDPPASFQQEERRASRAERSASVPDRATRESTARPEHQAREQRSERRDRVAPQPPRERSEQGVRQQSSRKSDQNQSRTDRETGRSGGDGRDRRRGLGRSS